MNWLHVARQMQGVPESWIVTLRLVLPKKKPTEEPALCLTEVTSSFLPLKPNFGAGIFFFSNLAVVWAGLNWQNHRGLGTGYMLWIQICKVLRALLNYLRNYRLFTLLIYIITYITLIGSHQSLWSPRWVTPAVCGLPARRWSRLGSLLWTWWVHYSSRRRKNRMISVESGWGAQCRAIYILHCEMAFSTSDCTCLTMSGGMVGEQDRRNIVSRSRNHCRRGNAAMRFSCTAEVHVTCQRYNNAECCPVSPPPPRFVTRFGFSREIFIEVPSIKFRGNPSSGKRIDNMGVEGRTHGRTSRRWYALVAT
jgi:hypothetical protein